MIGRWLEPAITYSALGTKMRFIAGPRQAGKTSLARTILESRRSQALLYNWDVPATRKRYRDDSLFYRADMRGVRSPWACFDEIHKQRRWKDILKGVFDADGSRLTVLVTGSARLNVFRRSGDSLAGRYFLFHLMPLALGELVGTTPAQPPRDPRSWIERRLEGSGSAKGSEIGEAFDALWRFGPFPEPLLRGNGRFARLWQRTWVDTVVQGDLRDLSRIRDLDLVEALIDLLPTRVASPLSINALSEDLEVAHATIKGILSHLERLLVTFPLAPWAKRVSRPVKKARKVYLYEWSRVEDPGARFENLVALELLALTHFWMESGGDEFALRFIRNREGKETDFLILRDEEPWCLVECKLRHAPVESHHLRYAHLLGGIPVVQLVRQHGLLRAQGRDVVSVSASRFLAG